MRTSRVAPIMLVLAAVGALAGCNASVSPPPPQTTGATTTPPPVSQEELAVAQHERDEARRELAEERARWNVDRDRLESQAASQRARNDLQASAWHAIGVANIEMDRLKNQMAHARTEKERTELRQTRDALKQRVDRLEARTRTIGADVGAGWENVRTEMTADIDAIEHHPSSREPKEKR